METTILLTKFWGWYFVIMFFLLIIYPKRIKQMMSLMKEENFMVILSIFTIILGLILVLVHNHWSRDWSTIITVLGWITLIKGISQFAFPSFNIELAEKIRSKGFQFLLIFLFIAGLFLLNQAYVWVQI